MEARKSCVVVLMFVLVGTFFLGSILLPENSRGAILYVGGVGPGNHTTIQTAVDNATIGDTVFVYSGTYNESVVVNKTLSLMGEDDTTVVSPVWNLPGFAILANWTNVTSFTIIGFPSQTTGIMLDSVHNCSVVGNNISANSIGLYFYKSRFISVANNSVLGSQYSGAYLLESTHLTLTNNTFLGDGVMIKGDSMEHWNTHEIDATNILNGGPIRYWKDIVGGTVPAGAGQVILANCTGTTVENQNMTNLTSAIALGFSNNNTVANSTVHNGWWGILIWHSVDNTIEENTLDSNIWGIRLYDSHNNRIRNNTGMLDAFGVYLEYSDSNRVENNTVDSYVMSFSLVHSNENEVMRNHMTNNSSAGIELRFSDRNTIGMNNVTPKGFGIKLQSSHGNAVEDNAVSSDFFHGMLIWSSNNNTVDGNTVYGCWEGFWISDSENNTYSNNNVSNNIEGFAISMSKNSSFVGNSVSWNVDVGFYFLFATNITLSGNEMIRDGIFIVGWSVENWNSHTIDTSNTVNSKPVRYWKDATGGMLPLGAGEVILANCTGVLVGNQNVSHATVGVQMGFSSNNTITNVTASGNSMDGIYLFASDGNLIVNSNVSENVYGISASKSDNNTFDGNAAIDNYVGLVIGDSEGNTISNSNLSANKQYGVYVSRSPDTTVASNNLSLNVQTGVFLWGSPDTLVVGNTLLSNNGSGIYVWSSSGNITGNTAWNNGFAGIYLAGNRGSNITDNTLHNNSLYNVGILNSINTTVSGNSVSNGSYGIYMDLSDGNIIMNNTATGNGRGIQLNESHDNSIAGNNVSGNARGISMYDSLRNTIFLNTIRNNTEWGMHLNSTAMNRIYHNWILNNSQQAFESGILNLWDNGYPSGGNYWSDYAGVDEKCGPNQDSPGSDGIGDTPYNLSGGVYWDRYPLMSSSPPPPMPPSAPLNLQATAGDEQVALAWSQPAFDGRLPITNFTIYRGTTAGGEVFLTEVGNVTAYNDTGLTNGQVYYYEVSANNAIGEGPRSNEVNATPMTFPGPPENLTALAGEGQVTLNWSYPLDDGGSAVTNFVIYRGTASGGETYLTTVGNVLSHVDNGLVNGVTYFYQVAAVNSVGEGGRSDEVNATPVTRPAVPLNLQAVAGNQLVQLTWQPPTFDGGSPITNYTVYRGTTPGGETYLTEVGNVLNFTDVGLTNGQMYYYQVAARNAVGEGERSNEAHATPVTVPSEPISLTAFAGDGRVDLVWSPPIDDGGYPVTNYTILRGTSSGAETFLVELGNVLDYADIDVVNGQTYFYQVTAKNPVGEGPRSSEVNATPLPPPGKPANVNAELSGVSLENVTITWSLSPDDGAGNGSVVAYSIQRGTTYDPDGLGYSALGAVLNGTTEFVDGLAGEGDLNSYFYRVCAVDLYDRKACADGQAGKFTRPLSSGPNLVSIPLVQSNESIEHVLRTVECDAAWAYDPISGSWKWYMPLKPYKGDLETIDHTMGVWVNVTADSNLTVAGAVPAQTTIQLRKGWNLVGFPSLSTSFTVADLKATVPVERVEAFDATAPPNFLRVLQDFDVLLAGHAYWVKVNQDTVWVISN